MVTIGSFMNLHIMTALISKVIVLIAFGIRFFLLINSQHVPLTQAHISL